MQNSQLQHQSDKYEIFSNGPGNMPDKADSLYNMDMDNIPQPQMQARGSLDMQHRSSLDMPPTFTANKNSINEMHGQNSFNNMSGNNNKNNLMANAH